MVSAEVEPGASHLVGLLEDTLQALAKLRAAAAQSRRNLDRSMAGVVRFSQNEIERLCAVIQRGWEAILRRLIELMPHDAESCAARWAAVLRKSLAEAETTGGRDDVSDAFCFDPRSLLATYRATCRALCVALEKARHLPDAETASLLSGLLSGLEKQLWLLDSPDRRQIGRPTVSLFLSC
jgi:hypothetical protein